MLELYVIGTYVLRINQWNNHIRECGGNVCKGK